MDSVRVEMAVVTPNRSAVCVRLPTDMSPLPVATLPAHARLMTQRVTRHVTWHMTQQAQVQTSKGVVMAALVSSHRHSKLD